jgi:drug/metabolite transporter (DMT)-like permease
MLWAILALFSALCDATYYAFVKRWMNIDRYVLAAGIFLVDAILLTIIVFVRGSANPTTDIFFPLAMTVAVNVIAPLLYFRALEDDFSLVLPMMAFTPLFLLVTSAFILGETPTVFGGIGVGLLVFGAYAMHLGRRGEHWLDPVRSIARHRGVRLMLIVAFLFSISTAFDKRLVQLTDPFMAGALTFWCVGVAFLCLALAKRRPIARTVRVHGWKFLALGCVATLGIIAINTAYTMQIVAYTVALKRTSGLFSMLFGLYLFKEENLIRRSIGAVVMLAGAALILIVG